METNHMNLVQSLSELGEAEFNAVAKLVAEEKRKRDEVFNKQKEADWKRMINGIRAYEEKYGPMKLSLSDSSGEYDQCENVCLQNYDEVGHLELQIVDYEDD